MPDYRHRTSSVPLCGEIKGFDVMLNCKPLLVGFGIFLLSSCVSVETVSHETAIETDEFGNRLNWTDWELDNDQIKLLTSSNTVVYQFSGISGRIVNYISLLNDDVKHRFGKDCGEDFISSHLFFYKESASGLSVVALSRMTPDPNVRIREFTNDAGEVLTDIVLVPGARSLEGCNLEYFIDPQTNEIRYIGDPDDKTRN